MQVFLADVDNLIGRHPKIAEPSPGRPTGDQRPLLRVCMVLLAAAWEVYVEDSILWAVEQLVERCSADQLPASLRALSPRRTRTVDGQTHGSSLETDGEQLQNGPSSAKFTVLANTASMDLTPLGQSRLTSFTRRSSGSSCCQDSTTFENVESELARFLRARGGVAHKGVTPKDLNLAGVYSWRYFIEQLAHELDTYLEQ